MIEDERQFLKYVRGVSDSQLIKDLSGVRVLGRDLQAIGKLRLYRLPQEVKNISCPSLNVK